MSYLANLGADEAEFDVESALKRQEARLERIQELSEKELFYRKVATGAAIVGGLMALTKLADIYRAVKQRRS